MHERLSPRLAAATTALVMLLAGTPPAVATYVCTVQPSKDGYVALRAGPSAGSTLIKQAKAGEALVIQQHPDGEPIQQGRWLRVFHFPGETIPEKSDPTYRLGTVGWMHRRYVDDCG